VYVHALFIVVVAATCGFLSLGAGLYFARSMLRLIYPELLERPHVLPTRYMALWDRECLMPGGKEARARFYIFTIIGIGALVVAAGIAAQIERTEPTPVGAESMPPHEPELQKDCEECVTPPSLLDSN
jgi:hypothetical protein